MKIIIALSTFNRPFITNLCLENLQAMRGGQVRLVIYDDASSAYSKAHLAAFADEVVRFPTQGGIERSRAKAMRDFVYRYEDFDLLYLTDNDTLHDPCFVQTLRDLFTWQAASGVSWPVSLFNSVFHNQPANIIHRGDTFCVSKTIAGVSQCYTRTMAETIVHALNRSPDLEFQYGWDYLYPKILNQAGLFTKTSYVEHFARDRYEAGLHAANSGALGLQDFERDRAINPTDYLAAVREEIIQRILG